MKREGQNYFDKGNVELRTIWNEIGSEKLPISKIMQRDICTQ